MNNVRNQEDYDADTGKITFTFQELLDFIYEFKRKYKHFFDY